MSRLIDRPSVRQDVALVLNRLPLVRWDRMIFDVDASNLAVYGWIPRSDGRQDFVLIHFFVWGAFGSPAQAEWRQFFTSSAKYSDEIHRLLSGSEAALDHTPCERVGSVLGELVPKAIRLETDKRPKEKK